jgi:5,5'-dehydrodivanillate O-demethylase oxygenase subunit
MAGNEPESPASDPLADPTAFEYTGPGTLAGRYLRAFWQPVALAADLPPGHAQPLRVMSEDFTLYRAEDGTPHVVAPRCAHRGTQLSTGWVEGDCLRCFYHGWKYDHTGQCVEMPAEETSFPPKVRIASYATQEYLGLVFAYLGEGAPPEFPRWPEFEQEGVLTISSYVRGCNYFNALENSHDPVHLAFVHRRSAFTANGLIGVPTVEAEETPWGVAIHATRRGGSVRTVQFCMPNMTRRTSPPDDPAETRWQEALAWRVPIDDQAYRSFNLDLAFLTGEPAERFRRTLQEREAVREAAGSIDELAGRVLRGELPIDTVKDHPNVVNIQDTVAQVGQGAIADRRAERLGRSDIGIILIRKIWERELTALAAGHRLKQWKRLPELTPTVGAVTV